MPNEQEPKQSIGNWEKNMNSTLRALTFAAVLLTATMGVRNWAVATTTTGNTQAAVMANGLGDPPPGMLAMNGLGDPPPGMLAKNGLGDPPPGMLAKNGLGDPPPGMLAMNGLGDPPPGMLAMNGLGDPPPGMLAKNGLGDAAPMGNSTNSRTTR